MKSRIRYLVPLLAATMVCGVASVGIATRGKTEAKFVVGKLDPSRPRPTAVPTDEPSRRAVKKPVFRGATNVPKDLRFFLVIGSDARPGTDATDGLADSIHVVAVDPRARTGTIMGIPRDSVVNVPGHGSRKINSALPLGGPELMVRTVRELTGLPVSHYAVTGFQGIVTIVDTLGGVVVNVPYAMNDPASGAYFAAGSHRLSGRAALAFSRARKTIPGGDLARSENHGRLMLAALAKFRAQATTPDVIQRWLGVLFANARLDMSMADAVALGSLARTIDPAKVRNVVARGAGGGSISLGEAAYALFRDVGADAEADGDMQRSPPVATPSPRPTPAPTTQPSTSPDALDL